MSAVRDRDWVRERRDQAIELREDGDLSESAAAFAALSTPRPSPWAARGFRR